MKTTDVLDMSQKIMEGVTKDWAEERTNPTPLTKEMELPKVLNAIIKHCASYGNPSRSFLLKVLQDFESQVIKQERSRLVEELQEIIGNNQVYLVPPGINRVYGYSNDEKTRVAGMYINGELEALKEL